LLLTLSPTNGQATVSTTQFVFAQPSLFLLGLILPLSSWVRLALFTAVALAALTAFGSGAQYLLRFFG
jgi:hypothetical protein